MAEPLFDAGATVRKVRSVPLWRALHRVLPLGQRLNALMARVIGPSGLIAVPWDGQQWLTLDAAWLGIASTASAPIYQPPRRQNPEFFALVAPMLARCGDGVIVDVGANIGVYTLNCRAVSAAPMIAFEPEPSIFRLLARNVADNALPSVTLRNVACGDRPGTLRFRTGINGEIAGDDEDGAIPVPVVRLDDELRHRRVAFIKIDCEGYEWQVLAGCHDIIATMTPPLFIELHPRLIARYGHSLVEVCDLMRPLYTLEFWQPDPAQYSRSRLLRFLARYRRGLRRYPGETSMLHQVARGAAPDQIFLCATPRGRAP